MTDLTIGSGPIAGPSAFGRSFAVQRKVDCGANPRTTAEGAVALFSVPAGTAITHCVVNVLTAEGATCTLDIGLTDTDGLVDGVNLNSVAMAKGAGTLIASGAYHLVSADDTVDMDFQNDASTAVFTVTLMGFVAYGANNLPST